MRFNAWHLETPLLPRAMRLRLSKPWFQLESVKFLLGNPAEVIASYWTYGL
jgi:hypothetical protein